MKVQTPSSLFRLAELELLLFLSFYVFLKLDQLGLCHLDLTNDDVPNAQQVGVN